MICVFVTYEKRISIINNQTSARLLNKFSIYLLVCEQLYKQTGSQVMGM